MIQWILFLLCPKRVRAWLSESIAWRMFGIYNLLDIPPDILLLDNLGLTFTLDDKPGPPQDDIADIETIKQEIADFETTYSITSEEFLSMRAQGKAGHILHASVWASLCGILPLSYRVDKPEPPT